MQAVKTGETDWRHASGVRETTPEESGLGRRTGRTGEHAPAHPFSPRGSGRGFLVRDVVTPVRSRYIHAQVRKYKGVYIR